MKTRIKIIVAIVGVCFATSLQAQRISMGIEAAATTSSVKISGIPGNFTDAVKGKGIMGYQAGVFLRLGAGFIYVKPKVLLDVQKGDLHYVVNESSRSVKFSVAKLMEPVLVGIKIIPPVLSIEGGPVFNQVLSSTKKIDGNNVSLNKSGIGYRVGVNVEIVFIDLTLSYQGMKNSGNFTSLASYDTPNQLIFGVGIRF